MTDEEAEATLTLLLVKQKAQSEREDPEHVVPNFYCALAPAHGVQKTEQLAPEKAASQLVEIEEEKERIRDITNNLVKNTLRENLQVCTFFCTPDLSFRSSNAVPFLKPHQV